MAKAFKKNVWHTMCSACPQVASRNHVALSIFPYPTAQLGEKFTARLGRVNSQIISCPFHLVESAHPLVRFSSINSIYNY